MTDASGTVVWAADYKPFGEATVTVSTITNNLRFPGQYFDAETGLHYNYFRDYDPAIGKYKQADPIGLKGGVNPYLYVSANPINIVDSLGLYDSYVHFDITYRLAIDAGFRAQDAYKIAQGNQGTDTNWNTAWWYLFGGIQLHFLPRDVALNNIDYALNYKSLEYFGRSLHMLQDTYSHDGYKWYKLGHLKDGHKPDNFSYSCGRDQKMLNETWQYLLKYREKYY